MPGPAHSFAAAAIERRLIVDRAEWLQWRMQDCTASDVSALFGAHPYGKTALTVWAEKTGLLAEGQADSAVLRRGRWAEPAILAMVADERPTWEIRPAKIYLRDPAIRLGATPDAAAIDPERQGVGVLQLKSVGERVFERDWSDGPPIGVQLQTLTEAMLAGASWAAIAALVMDAGGGWSGQIFDLERHEAAEARIRARVIDFWSMVERGEMPVLDPERDAETVSAIYPKAEIKDPPLDLSGDNALPIELIERARLKADVQVALAKIGAIETGLKNKLGPHERALIPGWRVSWKNEHHEAYTVPAADRRVLRVYAEKG